MSTKLILAQGAEHTNPTRLAMCVNKIVNQSKTAIHSSTPINDVIRDKFDAGFNCMFDDNIPVYFDMDYIAEEKYDGYSYLSNEGRFFSKRLSEAVGNVGQPIEKSMHVPHLVREMSRLFNEFGCDIHGEIYIPGGTSDNVTSILGCTPELAVARQEMPQYGKLHYKVVDMRSYKGKSLLNEPYYVRRALIEYMFMMADIHNFDLKYVDLAEVLPHNPVAEFKRIVRAGGEGIIIKNTKALYIPGKKPADNWIKGKKKITVDAVIIGYNDGTGKNKQLFGSIEFGLYDENGKLKKLGSTSSGLDDATRNMIADNPDKFIGHVVELEAIQESRNSLRNAVFIRLRDDKDKSECTIGSARNKEDLI